MRKPVVAECFGLGGDPNRVHVPETRVAGWAMAFTGSLVPADLRRPCTKDDARSGRNSSCARHVGTDEWLCSVYFLFASVRTPWQHHPFRRDDGHRQDLLCCEIGRGSAGTAPCVKPASQGAHGGLLRFVVALLAACSCPLAEYALRAIGMYHTKRSARRPACGTSSARGQYCPSMLRPGDKPQTTGNHLPNLTLHPALARLCAEAAMIRVVLPPICVRWPASAVKCSSRLPAPPRCAWSRQLGPFLRRFAGLSHQQRRGDIMALWLQLPTIASSTRCWIQWVSA